MFKEADSTKLILTSTIICESIQRGSFLNLFSRRTLMLKKYLTLNIFNIDSLY